MCLVCVVLCWIDHVWSSKECMCCACDPNERLSAPSICFVCVFVCLQSGVSGDIPRNHMNLERASHFSHLAAVVIMFSIE